MKPNLFKIDVAPPIDPLEQYGRFVTLRDMMDRRRLRDLQFQSEQLDLQQKQESAQEYRTLQDLFRHNPNPTDQEILGASFKLGQPVVKARFDRLKAAAETTKAELEAEEKRQDFVFSRVGSVMSEKDPDKRAALVRQHKSDLMEAGYLTPQQAALIPDDPGDSWYERTFRAVRGDPKWQEYQDKLAAAATAKAAEARAQAKETRDELLFGPQYGKAVAERESAQQEALGTKPITPYQRATLEQQGMPNTDTELRIKLRDSTLPPAKRKQYE